MKVAPIAAITLAVLVNFAPRSNAQKGPDKQAHSPTNKHPDTLASVPSHAESNQQNRPQSNQGDTEKKSPPWYETAEWVLVGIGAITAGVIGWQSWEARKAAQAALLNAKAIISNERAWIMLEKIEPGTDYWGIAQRETDAGKPVYALPVFKNYGNTPGWIVQSAAYIIMSNRAQGSVLTYGQPPIYPNPMPLPDKEQDYRFIVRMDRERVLSPQDIREIESGLVYLILYGFIKYKDPFFEQTKEYRTTKFSYALRLIHTKDSIRSFWEPFGSFGANENT